MIQLGRGTGNFLAEVNIDEALKPTTTFTPAAATPAVAPKDKKKKEKSSDRRLSRIIRIRQN